MTTTGKIQNKTELARFRDLELAVYSENVRTKGEPYMDRGNPFGVYYKRHKPGEVYSRKIVYPEELINKLDGRLKNRTIKVYRHLNPDKTTGGEVEVGAYVDPTAFIAYDALVAKGTWVGPNARIEGHIRTGGTVRINAGAVVVGNGVRYFLIDYEVPANTKFDT